MVPPEKISTSHRLKNLIIAQVYTWLFVHPGRQRGQPDHCNDHPGDHVGHLRVERVLPRDVFLPGCHEEHLAQTQLVFYLFEAGARTSDCHKVGLDARSPLWCRVRVSLTRKVIIAICFALWDIQVASKQILKIFVCRRLGGYMSTVGWIEEEEAVRSILARLSIAVDTSRWNFIYFMEWNVVHEIKSALPFYDCLWLFDAEYTGWDTTPPWSSGNGGTKSGFASLVESL